MEFVFSFLLVAWRLEVKQNGPMGFGGWLSKQKDGCTAGGIVLGHQRRQSHCLTLMFIGGMHWSTAGGSNSSPPIVVATNHVDWT